MMDLGHIRKGWRKSIFRQGEYLPKNLIHLKDCQKRLSLYGIPAPRPLLNGPKQILAD